MANEIKLQPPKEGVDSVEVNAIKVAVGDVVALDQPVLEVQADKAALEVTSPMAGRVVEVRVREGQELKVGQVYLVLDGANGATSAKKAQPEKPKAEKAKETTRLEPEKAKETVPAQAPPSPTVPEKTAATRPGDGHVAPAGPATRHLARELGVDLAQVRGTGRGGAPTQKHPNNTRRPP